MFEFLSFLVSIWDIFIQNIAIISSLKNTGQPTVSLLTLQKIPTHEAKNA